MSRRFAVAVLIPTALALIGCAAPVDTAASDGAAAGLGATAGHGIEVVVHKTASCECCGRYEEYLDGLGFTVTEQVHDDVTGVKDSFGVPLDERSCHTNEVGGYAAEGHVPAAALLELLEQAPEVGGISLAGMPAGSPGMPGEQAEPFVVRTFTDGVVAGQLGEY